MQALDDILSEMLRSLPTTFLENAIKDKAATAGVQLSDEEIGKGVQSILTENSNTFELVDIDGVTHTIEMTLPELENVLTELESFADNKLPEVVQKTADSAVEVVYKRLEENWADEHASQTESMAEFKLRLEERWGKPLGKLRMLLTICREWGQDVNERKRKAKSGQMTHLDDVLLRLHVRACQVTSEIIVLLENGFADGAMARWRTLHEITTVAMVIAKYGEDIGERYARYQIVEAMKAFNAYDACYKELGYEPYEEGEADRIRQDYAALLNQYGKEYGEEYGWASHALGKKHVNFAILQEAAGAGNMRAHYRMASHNVHAGPKGIYFKLGQFKETTTYLAGASNAGLFEPAQNAAISISKITSIMGCAPKVSSPSFSDIVYGKIVQLIVNEIPTELQRSDEALRRAAEEQGVTVLS